MGFIKEFKEFAVKGNVMDMAVGVIIGGAFGKIVTSLVNDVLMPLIGKLTGGVSFVDLFVNLGDGNYKTLAEAKEAGAAVFAYGQFIQNIVDFLIVAFCIFLMLKFPDAEGHQQVEPQEGGAQARRARGTQRPHTGGTAC